MTSPTKNLKPKMFFIANQKTHWVFWGFGYLSSTIDWRVMEMQNGVKLTAQCVVSKYDTLVHQLPTC